MVCPGRPRNIIRKMLTLRGLLSKYAKEPSEENGRGKPTTEGLITNSRHLIGYLISLPDVILIGNSK